MPEQLQSAVVLIIFNRPDLTQRVFDRIAEARPTSLFVIADGPRDNVPGEAERCEQARAIATQVDWPCKLETNFLDQNAGCYKRISSGLNWVFNRCEEAIILEDDCLPAIDFFRFCDELLVRYRNDDRVGMISGSAFAADKCHAGDSYYFTRYPTIWGWASWRRVWQQDHTALDHFDAALEMRILDCVFPDDRVVRYWTAKYAEKLKEPEFPWDLRLAFSLVTNSRLCVHPATNLISNLGIMRNENDGDNAVHPFYEMPTGKLEFPLSHPIFMTRNRPAEEAFEKICLLEMFPTGHASNN